MGITVDFHNDGCAVITMRNGQNRWNLMTLKQLNDALDEVEKSLLSKLESIGLSQDLRNTAFALPLNPWDARVKKFTSSLPKDSSYQICKVIKKNESARVLVTTGEGRFYSNGIDLDWLATQGRDTGDKFVTLLVDTMWRVMHFPLPTVAAINGHNFAGGAFLAMCHDYRVMRSDRGWISWNETWNSFRIPDSLTEILERKLSKEALRESVIFAKRITGPEAVKLKIVDKIESETNLISGSKQLGLEALGKNVIKREDLHFMKKDVIPRTIRDSKLYEFDMFFNRDFDVSAIRFYLR